MSEKSYAPPCAITDKMSNNLICKIHASLAIENNSLFWDQLTDIINGKSIRRRT